MTEQELPRGPHEPHAVVAPPADPSRAPEPGAPVPLAAGGMCPANDDVTAEIHRRVERGSARWELTGRQAQVLAEVARGRTNRRIAATLRCAESTIEIHMTALLAKADCHSRAELVAKFWIELA